MMCGQIVHKGWKWLEQKLGVYRGLSYCIRRASQDWSVAVDIVQRKVKCAREGPRVQGIVGQFSGCSLEIFVVQETEALDVGSRLDLAVWKHCMDWNIRETHWGRSWKRIWEIQLVRCSIDGTCEWQVQSKFQSRQWVDRLDWDTRCEVQSRLGGLKRGDGWRELGSLNGLDFREGSHLALLYL